MDAVANFHKYEKYVYACCKQINSKVAKTFGGESGCLKSNQEKIYFDDREDLYQQARVWLWEACLFYPKEKEKRELKNKEIEEYNKNAKALGLKLKKKLPIASFSTCAWMYLDNMSKNYNSKRKTYQFRVRSLGEVGYSEEWNEEMGQAPSHIMDREDFDAKITDKFYFMEFYNKLTEKEKDILYFYFIEGLTKKELEKLFPLYNNIDSILENLKMLFDREKEILL